MRYIKVFAICCRNNTKTLETPVPLNEFNLANSGCLPTEKFSIVLHGWIQSCSDEWAIELIESKFLLLIRFHLFLMIFPISGLSFYRRGCVICIDYSTAASSSYMRYVFN